MAEATFYNAAGELTLSADALTYGYLGKATLQSVGQSSGGLNKQAGSSTYTINWGADIIVAIPVKSGKTSALRTMTQSGGTWTITVHSSNGTTNADGFDVQEATEVFVFGAPLPGVETIGNLFDVNGNIVADLSRRPLLIRSRIFLPDSGLVWTMPAGMIAPAIIGWPTDRVTSSSRVGASYTNYENAGCWSLDPNYGNNLARSQFRTRSFTSDGPTSSASRPAIVAILIETNGLP